VDGELKGFWQWWITLGITWFLDLFLKLFSSYVEFQIMGKAQKPCGSEKSVDV
jgi:hypothetical protein